MTVEPVVHVHVFLIQILTCTLICFVGELTNSTDNTDDETHETGIGFGQSDHLSRQASLVGSSPHFQQSPLQQSLNMDMLVRYQLLPFSKDFAFILKCTVLHKIILHF